MHETILIVDDEDDIRLMIQGLLEDEGYKVLTAPNSTKAYEVLNDVSVDLVIQDIWLQGSEDDGIEILKNTVKHQPSLPFLMISGHGTIETAVSAIKFGAYDFIEKPFKSDRLLLMIHRALENASLKRQNKELKLKSQNQVMDQIGQIPEHLRQMLDKAASTNSRLWISGEAGTGKNIAAQYVHSKSSRSNQPFMVLNCAAGSTSALEEELFGTSRKPGLLELVDGGTLILDEVLMLPIEIQGKILMLLQESAYHKIDDKNKHMVDIRVIATSSQNAEHKIEEGAFRQDLYYRLNVVPIDVPPLRKRKADILQMIEQYSTLKFSEMALAKLQSYRWPGNVKQLHNVLEWVSIMHKGKSEPICIEDLPPEVSGKVSSSEDKIADDNALPQDILAMSLREARECFERYYLLSQVNKFDGNISKTAEFIGMERSALHRKLKSLDVFSDDKQNVA